MASNEAAALQVNDKLRAEAPSATANTRGQRMANSKTVVRQILDKVKAEGRSSLTAPEGKLVCDAYGIAVPKEVVAPGTQPRSRPAWAFR